MSTKFRTSRSKPFVKPYHFYKDSKVQPQFAFECDINNIVKGIAQPTCVRPVDTVGKLKVFSPDLYEQGLLKRAEVDNLFMQLPSDVRKRFKNNPAELLKFVSDDKNIDEGIKLGIFEKRQVDETITQLKEINSKLTSKEVISDSSPKSSTN